MYYYEVRTEVVRNHSPILVSSEEELELGQYNFRSTFDYPKEVADQIRQAGNTKNLKGCSLSCDQIRIDVDEEENVDTVRGILLSEEIAFEEYTTGNRGVHFHVPLASRITGTDVLYTITSWIKDAGLWTLVDSSFYHEGGQYRLEHATHQKTGKPKVLLAEQDGELLDLELLKTPDQVVQRRIAPREGDAQEFFMNLLLKRGVGERHLHMFIIWKSGMAAGFSEDAVGTAIKEWNAAQDDPHSESMVETKIAGFARKIGGVG